MGCTEWWWCKIHDWINFILLNSSDIELYRERRFWRGLVFSRPPENGIQPNQHDRLFLKCLSFLPLKIITYLGNHENYDTISMLPKTEAYGGRTVKLYDNIELLDRCYVFTIEGKKLFTLVGATSSDKQFRTEHEIWWPQETVTEEKFQRSLNELAKVNFKIDTVLTHTAPSWILSSLMDF